MHSPIRLGGFNSLVRFSFRAEREWFLSLSFCFRATFISLGQLNLKWASEQSSRIYFKGIIELD